MMPLKISYAYYKMQMAFMLIIIDYHFSGINYSMNLIVHILQMLLPMYGLSIGVIL
ncbi:Uncharacterised protein [Vibrio cholerae]|nr:Uncharacterised protein [Vibrio cholerae]